LLEKKVGITKVRGHAIQLADFVVFPLLHPAAALHQSNLKVPLKEDFQKLKTVLEHMSNTPTLPKTASPPTLPTSKSPSPKTPANPPTQMSLF
ncbi:MAG: uracil-DNA glycosylase, partial [Nitrospirota bacterium]|nr:uracil-DNA glycosylase [Nitrospirota bacterium]